VFGDEEEFDDSTPQGDRTDSTSDNPNTGVGLTGISGALTAASALAASSVLLAKKKKPEDSDEE
jgi:hypothetical protein